MPHERLFFALPINGQAKAAIIAIMKTLQSSVDNDGIKWVPPENLHVTLRFLGQVSPAQKQQLIEAVSLVIKTIPPFSMTVGGLMLFPQKKAAKYLVLKVGDHPVLTQLAEKLDKIATKVGCQKEHFRFRPHISIARLKAGAEIDSVFIERKPHDYEVNEVALFSSVSNLRGVRYVTVTRWGLDKSGLLD